MKDSLNWLAGEVRILRKLVEASCPQVVAPCVDPHIELHCAPIVKSEISFPRIANEDCVSTVLRLQDVLVFDPVFVCEEAANAWFHPGVVAADFESTEADRCPCTSQIPYRLDCFPWNVDAAPYHPHLEDFSN